MSNAFEETPTFEGLAHHGVKGMHWGQHRISDIAPTHHVRSAASKVASATSKTAIYAANHKRQILAAAVIAQLLVSVGSTALTGGNAAVFARATRNRATAARGAEMAGRLLSSSAHQLTYAKMARGAYNITTMK